MATDDDWKGRRTKLGEDHVISVRLERQMHDRLHELAKTNDTTVAAITRHSLARFLEQQGDKPKRKANTASVFG